MTTANEQIADRLLPPSIVRTAPRQPSLGGVGRPSGVTVGVGVGEPVGAGAGLGVTVGEGFGPGVSVGVALGLLSAGGGALARDRVVF